MSIRTWFFRCMMVPLVLVITMGGYYAYLLMDDNFHEVIPGELYRSAQPSGKDIKEYVDHYHIKSILNLRGESDKKWYGKELEESNAEGIKHIDFRMYSTEELTQDQAVELINIMRDAPKPLLIHCDAGANRTGLAAALYLAAIKKESEFNAEMQLSPLYGHFPIWFTKRFAMDRTFEKLEPIILNLPES